MSTASAAILWYSAVVGTSRSSTSTRKTARVRSLRCRVEVRVAENGDTWIERLRW